MVCSPYCCVNGHPTRIKDGDSNTSQDGQSTGSQLVHKHTFVAWDSSVMLIKINLFHPFLDHSQNQLRLQWHNWNSTWLLLNPSSFFHGARLLNPRGYRDEINLQVRITLSKGDLLNNTSKVDPVGKGGKVGLGFLQQAEGKPEQFQLTKCPFLKNNSIY